MTFQARSMIGSGDFSSCNSFSPDKPDEDNVAYGALATFTVNEDILYCEIAKARDRRQTAQITFTAATASQGATKQGTPSFFFDAFESELFRVTDFIDAQQKNLEFSAKALLTNAEVALEVQDDEDSDDLLLSLKRRTEDFVDSCLKLQAFTTNNKEILQSVAKLADKELKTTCAGLLERRFANAGINSALICVASDIYDAIRKADENLRSRGSKNGAEVWTAPSSFERSTTKYWVEDRHLTKLLLTCAREAPLLVYGKKGALTSKSHRLSRQSEGDKLWDALATTITSVYFDSADMGLYKDRIARVEGAQLLRARWYGSKPTGNELIFLELKTHHEKWVNTKSVKERASVRESDMASFLEGIAWTLGFAEDMILRASPTLKGDKLTKAAELLLRMHNLVVKHKLVPRVRSVYMRAAFQSPQSNELRLTVDRNVTLIDESARSPSQKSWCLPDDALIEASMAVQVPFVIFEVKLAGEDGMPTGLANLEFDNVIQEAAKFSKFLTGAAAFNSHKLATLPYWAEHPSFARMFGLDQGSFLDDIVYDTSALVEKPARTSLIPASVNTFETSETSDNNWTASLSLSGVLSSGSNKETSTTGLKRKEINKAKSASIAPKKPARVEPKSYFANERTFIQWISASLMLLAVSSIMLGYGDGKYFMGSAVICFSAVFLVLYSTFTYFRRIRLLTSGKPYGYIDFVGPAIVAVGVTVGVSIVLADFIEASTGSSASKGSSNQEVLREEAGACFRNSIEGMNTLQYQPSDVIVDVGRNALLVASTQEIVSHPMGSIGMGGPPSQLVEIPNSELEGLTSIGDRLFALSEGPQKTELIELAWTSAGSLELQTRWTISDVASQAEGLTFVPKQKTSNGLSAAADSEPEGRLYIAVDGLIHSYEVPSRADSSVSSGTPDEASSPPLTRVNSLNMKLILNDLGNEDKIAAMHYFEGVTYLLHDNRKVVHAWNLETGEFLAEIPLPRTKNFSDQWEGIALERRHFGQQPAGSLRGSNSADATALILHLTLDTPPQIWTFRVEEGQSRGSFTLPDCAAAGEQN